MAKYLKLFETTTEYEDFVSTDFDKPNVSYCEDGNEMHYNPIPPMNVIYYTAPAKLTESTSLKDDGSLHVNNFYGTENQLTMTNHEFNNGNGVITFDADVVKIGQYAFRGCSTITSVIIPISVTNIGENAFAGCTGLTNVIIPNSVTSTGYGSFSGCSGLTSVTIGNGVTSINSYAFENCSGLISVTIPNSVTSIDSYAFQNCSSLTSVTIPNSVTNIGSSAFYQCSSLTSMTIPSNVTNIGTSAFLSCHLSSVTIEATTPPSLIENGYTLGNTFNGSYPIYVPAASVDTYKTASGWNTYTSRIQAIPTT